MRYASIDKFEIINGTGIGVSLFVQGCHFHCNNCFNPSTWDFNGGYEWNDEVKKYFLQLAGKNYIKRISILGGEPLCDENVLIVFDLINAIKKLYPSKLIWLYTGYTWEDIFTDTSSYESFIRKQLISICDYVVDGQYIDTLHKSNLLFKGSSNQRVINVLQSLETNCVVEEY